MYNAYMCVCVGVVCPGWDVLPSKYCMSLCVWGEGGRGAVLATTCDHVFSVGSTYVGELFNTQELCERDIMGYKGKGEGGGGGGWMGG